jgi:hypothetical protein
MNMKPIKSLRNRIGRSTPTPPATMAGPPTAASPPPTPAAPTATKTVTIEARIDVGFGNRLYLRGEGTGLSWSRGIPLTCVEPSTWKWSGEAGDAVKFKLLLNDAVWCQGEDLVARPGQQVRLTPAF